MVWLAGFLGGGGGREGGFGYNSWLLGGKWFWLEGLGGWEIWSLESVHEINRLDKGMKVGSLEIWRG